MPWRSARIPSQRLEAFFETKILEDGGTKVIAKRAEERCTELVEACDLPLRQSQRQRVAEGRAQVDRAADARCRGAGECVAGEHARLAHRPGRCVQIEEPPSVDVGIRIHARPVGGRKKALDDLVVAELVAELLGEEADPARHERRGGRCSGLFEREVALRRAGRTVEAGHRPGDVHARRGKAEVLRDTAAIGELRDRALLVRRHDGKRMTAQLRDTDRKSGHDLDRTAGLDRAVGIDLAASVAGGPHVDGAFADRSALLSDRLDDIGKAAAQFLRTKILDVAGKAEAGVDRRHPVVELPERRCELRLKHGLDTKDQIGKLLDLLGRGVLGKDLLDDFVQAGEAHRDHLGIEGDAVDGGCASRGRQASGTAVGMHAPASGHDAGHERPVPEDAETGPVESRIVASAEVGLVALDVADLELPFELGMTRVYPAVDNTERDPFAGRAACVGIVRLDLAQPVLIAELGVRGILASTLFSGRGVGGTWGSRGGPGVIFPMDAACQHQHQRRHQQPLPHDPHLPRSIRIAEMVRLAALASQQHKPPGRTSPSGPGCAPATMREPGHAPEDRQEGGIVF